MRLNEWVAERKMAIFESLKRGEAPGEGEFDEKVLREALDKGSPHLGTTRYEPDGVYLEFIFQDPEKGPTVLAVRVASPERIVYLPVPDWVVEQVWQGEVYGTYEFESVAEEAVKRFLRSLEPEENANFFPLPAPKRRG
jgi:hypothetical protein